MSTFNICIIVAGIIGLIWMIILSIVVAKRCKEMDEYILGYLDLRIAFNNLKDMVTNEFEHQDTRADDLNEKIHDLQTSLVSVEEDISYLASDNEVHTENDDAFSQFADRQFQTNKDLENEIGELRIGVDYLYDQVKYIKERQDGRNH